MFKRGDVVRNLNGLFTGVVMKVNDIGNIMIVTSLDPMDHRTWEVPSEDYLLVTPAVVETVKTDKIDKVPSSINDQIRVLRKQFMELGTQLIQLSNKVYENDHRKT